MGLYRRRGKRALDLVIAIPLLVLLSPILAGIGLAVRLWMGPPVFFRQTRPGLRGRPFTALKFRSMAPARDAAGRAVPDDSQEAYAAARSGQRITRLGRLLRDTSLDELPGLFNVVRGDMSLVGPRPLLAEYLDRYTPEQRRRHLVRPGITGWAQVHGRQAMDYEERFALDVWYVDHLSLSLDLRIMATTIPAVLARRGTHEAGYATGTEFMGSSDP